MKIAIGCDEAAYDLKMAIIEYLNNRSDIELKDFGSHEGEQILYPNVAKDVAEAIRAGDFQNGILLCGTGIGMAITANKVTGIRAAVCHDPYSAERSRKSNDVQIMCMGARIVGVELAKYLVDIWLGCEFSGGGSAKKVKRIEEIEKLYRK